MKLIRLILGQIILFLDRMTSPQPLARPKEIQAQVDAQTRFLTLYEFNACPFCVKVRRATRRLSLPIQTKDVQKDESARAELMAGGGEYQVPCLRIQKEDGSVQWMYESSDIIQYLEGRFGSATPL